LINVELLKYCVILAISLTHWNCPAVQCTPLRNHAAAESTCGCKFQGALCIVLWRGTPCLKQGIQDMCRALHPQHRWRDLHQGQLCTMHFQKQTQQRCARQRQHWRKLPGGWRRRTRRFGMRLRLTPEVRRYRTALWPFKLSQYLLDMIGKLIIGNVTTVQLHDIESL
jgi:hypothetical protein